MAMLCTRIDRRTGFAALIVAGWMALHPSAAPLEAAQTIIGSIVEIRPDTRSMLLRVGFSDGQALLRRFELPDSTRFRVNGGFARIADVLVGQTARVTYLRTDDANVAELVEVTEAPPASSMREAAREASGIESRKRYLEGVASTLDVLEESVGELRRHPDVEGTDELARLSKTIEELEIKLSDSRALLSSLSATGSQDAWRHGVDQLETALEELTQSYERGWSEVTNR
jgi:hypothetical protein